MSFHQGTVVLHSVERTVPVIQEKNLLLRPANPADVDARLALGRDPEIVEMFGVSRDEVKPMTREGAAGWVQSTINHPHAWIIEVDGALVGEIKLDNVDRTDRRATMAIAIYDPNLLGKGIGTRAIRLLLQYAFADLRLHRIGIRVLAYNKRAIRAYEKCGFVLEGRERETAFVNGAWHDDLMMGIVEHEFLPLKEGDRSAEGKST